MKVTFCYCLLLMLAESLALPRFFFKRQIDEDQIGLRIAFGQPESNQISPGYAGLTYVKKQFKFAKKRECLKWVEILPGLNRYQCAEFAYSTSTRPKWRQNWCQNQVIKSWSSNRIWQEKKKNQLKKSSKYLPKKVSKKASKWKRIVLEYAYKSQNKLPFLTVESNVQFLKSLLVCCFLGKLILRDW